jgi:hypothetical protein
MWNVVLLGIEVTAMLELLFAIQIIKQIANAASIVFLNLLG